jgi:hypothetical protein
MIISLLHLSLKKKTEIFFIMNNMKIILKPFIFTLTTLFLISICIEVVARSSKTKISIRGEKFFINGKPTYKGRTWQSFPIEGLLLNSRMVQGTFDDLNLQSVANWKYPDNQKWDPDRNTSEFITAMPEWKKHGLLAITLNFQGGSPQGYSKEQPWENNAFEADGTIRLPYASRMERIIKKADDLGMVVILGIFYFGQDQRLKDEQAVKNAVANSIEWLFEKGFKNVLVEVNNECNVKAYDHDILKPDRVHELIELVKSKTKNGYRYLVGTSYGGGSVPKENVVRASDFILIHGNGVTNPARIGEMVSQTRQVNGYRPMPIVFNEDDHFDFDKPSNNFVEAVKAYASWGYFDYRMKDEGFDEGYQSVPVNWGISSVRKRGFFNKLKEITGGFKK